MDPMTFLLHKWWQELHISILLNPSFLFSLLLLFSLLYFLKLSRGAKLNLPPSPPKLPIIGNLHQLGSLLHRSLHAISEKYGPVVLLHVGNTPFLVVSSSEIAREVLKGHDTVFSDRPQTRATNVLFYGCTDIAFCPYGEYWRHAKKICVLEILSQRRVQGFQFVREEETSEMVEKIQRSCMNGAAIDLGEMFVAISNNITCRASLGQKYEGEEGSLSFGHLSRKAMGLVGAFCFGDFFPYLGWIDVLTGFSGRLRTTSKAINTALDQIIEEHEKRGDTNQSDKKDFVDILLYLQKNGMLEIILTKENIKAILLDMFMGGTDTTASTMEWAMAELVKNPSVMRKAQEEVRAVVGKGKKAKVDEADIDQMDYLKCIVKETLRLHAPAMISRKSSASAKVEGYDIPPGTTVLVNTWTIQRDPKLWDRPEEFLPERFINNPIDFKGHHDEFIPFGMGSRGCPGIAFAIIEAEYVLANLLYWFDWELLDGATLEQLDMSDMYRPIIGKKTPLLLVPLLHSPK
ncbi:cytochrome P450 71A1-like [Juglans microcarpa x Juglans regia]|uniref:cytochrome P450 71A1-like n=1 Tax=Juglans microcarpa x Juglans regia TaxID=2249226 RepID=UPI001B7E7B09|nr:cytochrome P450 71A1-like [Juglans microcarpa x Juglans regia]